jgi:DNA-binding MarR family transcriptional regulator
MSDSKNIDDILTRLFITTLKIEERAIAEGSQRMLSISELHVLREIGSTENPTMSQVARGLKISVSALTIAMNRLEAKGFVVRSRDEKDRRIVNLSLTLPGLQAFRKHDEFHSNMVSAAVDTLTPSEKEVLVKSLTKLDDWFAMEWKRMQIR